MRSRRMLSLWVTLVLFFSSAVHAETLPSVRVTGVGEVRALPDKATIHAGAERRADTVKAAEAHVKSRIDALLDALATLKVAPGDVDSSQVTIRPEMRWDKETERSVPDGYLVQRDVRVVLNDLTLLGPVLAALHDAGMDRVQPAQLDLQNRDAVERRALALAAQDGRARAEALANALDLRLGRAMSVVAQDSGDHSPPVMPMMRMAADAEQGNAAQAITIGEITVAQRVSVEFALLP
jgi:uncharacterized protein